VFDRELLLLLPDVLPVLLPPLDLEDEEDDEAGGEELPLFFFSFSWAKTPATRASNNTANAMLTLAR
jgi:hypothetical protein